MVKCENSPIIEAAASFREICATGPIHKSKTQVLIYGLIDPVINKIRYIGKTVCPLPDRLKVHIWQSKKTKKPTHKEAWIISLLRQDLKPKIILLQTCDLSNWANEEKDWIKCAREFGLPITNISLGGDAGFLGGKHTDEYKAWVSQQKKGKNFRVNYKWSDEQREKMKNRRVWNKGKKGTMVHSEEFKKRMSERIKGDRHHSAKMTKEQVAEARGRFSRGEKATIICKSYGVTYSHMLKVVKGKLWQV